MTKLNQNDKIKQELLEPLPSEALKQHPTRKYLTTINSIYVIERLNNVFGLDGWKAKYEVVFQDDSWVVAKCFLTAGEIAVEQYGGNDNVDIGDRFKGACTDALTKCASYIGVGSHVWKNEKVAPARKQPSIEMMTIGQTNQIKDLIKHQSDDIKAKTKEWLNNKQTKTGADKMIQRLQSMNHDSAIHESLLKTGMSEFSLEKEDAIKKINELSEQFNAKKYTDLNIDSAIILKEKIEGGEFNG